MRYCSFSDPASAAKYSPAQMPSQNLPPLPWRSSRAAGPSVFQFPSQRFPVRAGPQALQNVDLVGVPADQNARFAALDTSQNTRRGSFRGSPRKPVKPRDVVLALRRRYRGAQPRMAGDRRANASRMDAGDGYRAAFELVSQRLRESPHRKFARGVRYLPGGSDEPEYARQIHDVRAALPSQHRQEILHPVDRAPEIDIHQPAEIVERNFFKIAVERHARIVDQQRNAPVPDSDVLSERTHALFLGDVHQMRRKQGTLALERFDGLRQARFVDIRKRQRRPRLRQLLG